MRGEGEVVRIRKKSGIRIPNMYQKEEKNPPLLSSLFSLFSYTNIYCSPHNKSFCRFADAVPPHKRVAKILLLHPTTLIPWFSSRFSWSSSSTDAVVSSFPPNLFSLSLSPPFHRSKGKGWTERAWERKLANDLKDIEWRMIMTKMMTMMRMQHQHHEHLTSPCTIITRWAESEQWRCNR